MSWCIVPKDCREIGQNFVLREILTVDIEKNVILNFHLLMFCTNIKTNSTSYQILTTLNTVCIQFIQESSLIVCKLNMKLVIILLQYLGLMKDRKDTEVRSN
jgi:hypothetical protein